MSSDTLHGHKTYQIIQADDDKSDTTKAEETEIRKGKMNCEQKYQTIQLAPRIVQ